MFAVLGTLLCAAVSRRVPPSGFINATCLWNIFFSYLRDKSDLHFPLNKSDYASFFFFFFQISDIWSSSDLFSYVTFSNNLSLGASWASGRHQWKQSPHRHSCCRVGGAHGSLASLSWWILFGYTLKLLYGGFWVDSLKGWFFFFFLVMIFP